MPSPRKKGDKKAAATRRMDDFLGDVTIDDFANTLQIHARLKKAATNVSNEVKQEAAVKEKSWEERYENLLAENTKNNQDTRKSKRKMKCQEDIKEEGISYPLDIWYMISEYIPPEAVGKFARICKSAYYVTTTAKFWFHLYKTYYKFVPELPDRLQPQCMMRHRELRACVIRALHYNYFTSLLLREVDDVSYFRYEEPHSLVRRKCILMWHKRGKMRWYFYFKLKEISKAQNNSLKQNKECNNDEFVEMLKDVAANPEEGCKVLRVSCLTYSMIPPVIGLVLQTVSVSLMPNYRKYRLHFTFGTSVVPSTLTNDVILSNVISYRILDWWDPYYPHHDTVYSIDYQESDSD